MFKRLNPFRAATSGSFLVPWPPEAAEVMILEPRPLRPSSRRRPQEGQKPISAKPPPPRLGTSAIRAPTVTKKEDKGISGIQQGASRSNCACLPLATGRTTLWSAEKDKQLLSDSNDEDAKTNHHHMRQQHMHRRATHDCKMLHG